ncbi:MAG: hypothetical protein KDB03_12265 [Planctomycetales bacterium]|nr:hypothetical protein [Planctomycetales bacterium]
MSNLKRTQVWQVSILLSVLSGVVVGEEISAKRLAGVWAQTRVNEVICGFHYTNTWINTASSENPFASPLERSTPQDLSVEGRFCRRNETGMRLDLGDRRYNLLDEQSLSIDGPYDSMEGFHQAVTRKRGDSIIQSLAVTDFFLAWVDPLAVRPYAEIAALGNAKFPIVRDPDEGVIVRIELGDETVVLAQNCDWRAIYVSTSNNGIPQSRYRYVYDQVQGRPRLMSVIASNYNPDGSLLNQSVIAANHWVLKCTRADLELQIPPDSLVYDDSGDEPLRYIIRADGTRRNYDEAEGRLASTLRELADSEPGELLNKNKK